MNNDMQAVLKGATRKLRTTMEEEFQGQLEGKYNIIACKALPSSPPSSLSPSDSLKWIRLVDSIKHRISLGISSKKAINNFIRESAFTFLNRIVAVRMLESRGMIQECIARGRNSSGLRDAQLVAPGLSSLGEDGYKLYLEAVFDEIGSEVKVLFDRRDPTSILWPGDIALEQVLGLLNNDSLEQVWMEDEAIGWFYQFFNDPDERRKIRKESSEPRDSYELAIRNQFFTPEYVVKLLVDNTLGRIWFEMQQGDTSLTNSCDMLAISPNVQFLDQGEKLPEQENDSIEIIPFRPKKDPRDIRIMDPACGSGHFLLYCFDLLSDIYEEAWNDPQSPISSSTGNTLQDDYETLEELKAEIPHLILRYNLHGIEIDQRCAQIASSALWMRAQRALKEQGFKRGEIKKIQKVNIILAEPMPGEDQILKEVEAQLPTDSMKKLIENIFQSMSKADELGSLLKIENEIEDWVDKARKSIGYHGDTLPGLGPELLSGLEDIDTDDPWQAVDLSIRKALEQTAETAFEEDGFRKKLFADDAVRGFAFIEASWKQYDVVLMNPPFGKPTKGSKNYMKKTFPRTKNDIYAAFVERWLHKLEHDGMLGAITSRTGFFLTTFQKWREEILLQEAIPILMADLGYGVLDAMVETAAFTLRRA